MSQQIYDKIKNKEKTFSEMYLKDVIYKIKVTISIKCTFSFAAKKIKD